MSLHPDYKGNYKYKWNQIPFFLYRKVFCQTKLTNSKLKRLINDFKQSGGQALEIINGYQNPDKSKYLQELCIEFNLKASIGSDFHRPNNWAKLGTNTNLIANVETVWDTF